MHCDQGKGGERSIRLPYNSHVIQYQCKLAWYLSGHRAFSQQQALIIGHDLLHIALSWRAFSIGHTLFLISSVWVIFKILVQFSRAKSMTYTQVYTVTKANQQSSSAENCVSKAVWSVFDFHLSMSRLQYPIVKRTDAVEYLNKT